ncbi:hypothetical protein Q1695_008935 [Nippostrongylus brasiliensis]|nr:hypothetical protein Q1695_008935 [Nippostrongylus brasiliensis]
MEKDGTIDSNIPLNINDVAWQTSRVLDELFKSFVRHPDFIRSVLWSLRRLLLEEPFTEECEVAVKSGVCRLAELFAAKPLWTQLLIVNELRRFNLPEVVSLVANALPRLPSYAMAFGNNSMFTLALAADGPVDDARKVPLDEVKKVSMSSSHTLFLTEKGEVFACGVGSNFDTGEDHGNLIVNPIKINFPDETMPVVDLAAGPHHSVFITCESVYVCGMNSNYCIGQKQEGCQYSLRKIKLSSQDKGKKASLHKVFTNASCTMIFAYGHPDDHMWIVGKTPYKTFETFKKVEREIGVFEIIRSNNSLLCMSSVLATVIMISLPVILPVSVVSLNYERTGLKNIQVFISNTAGVLNYAFNPSCGHLPFEPCIVCINGMLVNFHCVDFCMTEKGDVFLMGCPKTTEGNALYHGKAVVIGEKVVEDGFISVCVKQSDTSRLRILLLLQEVPGAHYVSSFACSPDCKNVIYVTNSSTGFKYKQWETTNYEKLNEEREISCLERIDPDTQVIDTTDVRYNTFRSTLRTRFPNVDRFLRGGKTIRIEELSEQITNMQSDIIFRNYLILNENRVLDRDAEVVVDKVCRILGVPMVKHRDFLQIGVPLDDLEKFDSDSDCVLVSETGSEIVFSRQLLEMQSSYFGVAFTYQHGDDVPRLKLHASETLIRRTLLSIINPNYLLSLQIHEILEMLPFLDQYLLYSVVADAIRVLFEQVNEFNVAVIFDLYENVPQLQPLIAELFGENLHLLTMWKNSTMASVGLIRDVFAYVRAAVADESEERRDMSRHLPYKHRSDVENKKCSWNHFRTEDVAELLLGSECRDAPVLHGLLEYLEKQLHNHRPVQPYSSDSPEPTLVATIRSRIVERTLSKAAKRVRKKSSHVVADPTPEFTVVKDLMNALDTVAEEKGQEKELGCEENVTASEPAGNVVEEVPNVSESSTPEKDDKEVAECGQKDAGDENIPGVEDSSSSSEVKEGVQASQHSTTTPWKVEAACSPPAPSPFVLEESPVSSKRKSKARFTPAGAKFRDASNLLREAQKETHFAPWAGASPRETSNVVPLEHILKEEAENAKSSSRTTPRRDSDRSQRRRTSGSSSWSQPLIQPLPTFSPACSPQNSSFVEIVEQEEKRLKEGTRRISRPLHLIEAEEQAIQELLQLYRENAGDEVVVRIERCANSSDSRLAYPPLWANTPHFRL